MDDSSSVLLLFSNDRHDGLRDYVEGEARLDRALSISDLQRVPVPGDGDCCFSSISIGIDSFFDNKHEVCTYLNSINISANQPNIERISTLRKLLVDEWLGMNSEQCSLFSTSSHQSSFEETALSFLNHGTFDCELGNSVLLALCNALKIPIVIYSSINSYPIIPLIPRENPLSNVPIYVAFNQSGKGHYDAVTAVNSQSSFSEKKKEDKEKQLSCSCGKGGAKDKSKAFCASVLAMGPGVSVFKILQDALHLVDV